MISDAALARLEQAGRTTNLKDEPITVSSNDVYAAVREIRELRRKADGYDELKGAIEVIGKAFKGHRGDI